MLRWIRTLRKRFIPHELQLRGKKSVLRRSKPAVRPSLEVLEDRMLPSGSPLNPQQIIFTASPPASPDVAILASDVSSMIKQETQLIATIVQYASNAWNTLGQEIIQEVAALQQQWGCIFGTNPNTQNQSIHATLPQSSSASGTGQSHASGSGSGSGTTTTAHDDSHPTLEKALPLTDSGDGSGSASASGSSSFNASVTGQVWLDNNGDGILDDNEMGYVGATVNLLYQVSGPGGVTWATLGSTTTNSNPEGNNYSIGAVVPGSTSYTCEIEVVFPPYFTATYPSAQSVIDAEGFSPVFSLSAGDMAVKPAGLRTMNVNTLDDDIDGPIQQNIVTLRDAIQTGNNGPPFAAITFDGTPAGTLSLDLALPDIEESYNINGPGASTLTVKGVSTATVFIVDTGVTSSIKNLSIVNGGGTDDGGGIYNQGDLTLWTDIIKNNHVSGAGGGIYNASSAELTLDGCIVTNNTASIIGGGIANQGKLYVLLNSQIYFNAAKYGGGIINTSTGTAKITDNSAIYNNTASSNGGGLLNSGAVTMSSVSLSGNKATAGGGIYSMGGSITLTKGTVSANQANAFDAAPGGGGGIYVGAGSLVLTGVEVSLNKVSGGGGAGIDIAGGTVTVSRGTIEFNTSQNNGGGIYNAAGTLTLKGGVYIGSQNSAEQGGGIYLGNLSKTTFSSVTVSGNVASSGGAGVYEQTRATVSPDPPKPPKLNDYDDPNGNPVVGS